MQTIRTIILLATFIFATNTPFSSFHKTQQYITDKLGLTSIRVNNIITPNSIEELQNIVRTNTRPISIAGTCYSQGGQTGYPDGLVINMKKFNKIITFNEKEKTITIEAGATWYDVQKYVDPYNLSVKAMQSYNNFSVGGSISVNAHGRDITHGSVINGIQSIQIMLADGTIVTADRKHHNNLFKAVIGGYGLLGIITQATIELTENVPLERVIQPCTIRNFKTIFDTSIASDESVVFYNTDIFPKKYQQCLTTTWRRTTKNVTDKTHLQKQNSPFYMIDKSLEMFVRRVPLASYSRASLQQSKKFTAPVRVVWRNNEMSYSVNQLAIDYHYPSTMTLQEYFIPVEHAQAFAKKLTTILQRNWVNVLNISIRHVKADTTSLMSYAPQESFAFVLYLNIFNNRWAINSTMLWTKKIIDAALTYNGTYYLPYIQSATKQQFKKAYPQFDEFLKLKQQHDPNNKFRNMLFHKYYELS